MIYRLIVLILNLLPLMIFPQGLYQVHVKQERSVGINLITGDTIKATEYIFPEQIRGFIADSGSGIVTVKLQKTNPKNDVIKPTGYLLLYDINKNLFKGMREINYLTDSLFKCNSGFVHSMPDKSNYRSFITDGKSYSIKNNIVYIGQKSDLGLGYHTLAMNEISNTLEGVRLTDGKVLWERELARVFGWNDVFYLNDSVLMVVASGLHAINVNNGKGWSYYTKTGIPDIKKQLTDLIVRFSYSYFTGMFLEPTDQTVTSGLVSNVVIDENKIYFAAVGKVVCLDNRSGRVLWIYKYPEKLSSKSKLFIQDGKLILINSGLAKTSSGPVLFGKPFISAIEPETGKGIYLYYPENGTSKLLDYRIVGKRMFVLSDQSISEYFWEDGKVVRTRTINTDKFTDPMSFPESEIFVASEDSSGGFVKIDCNTQLLVQDGNGQILLLNSEIQTIKSFKKEDVYQRLAFVNGISFLTNGKDIMILDRSNNIIANLWISDGITLLDNKLYANEGRSLYVIDLSSAVRFE